MGTAPAMTKRSVGSQWPETSRKLRTRAGLTISATASPTPNRRPANNEIAGIIGFRLAAQMARDEHGHHRRSHESRRRDDGAPRHQCQAANAVTAGTTRADRRAKSHHESSDHHRRQAGRESEAAPI